MKKFVSILLIVTLAMGILAGCGGNKEEKSTSVTNTKKVDGSNKVNDKKESDELITIDWMPQNDQPVDKDSPVIAELEKRLNVKFNFIYMDRNKSKELLNIRIASGEIPDVMRLNEDVYRSYIGQGILAEIPENKIKEISPNLYDITLKNGGNLAWEYAKENNKIYGMPYLSLNGNYHYVPVWNEDWLKQVGVDKVPETLAEAEEVFYKFKNDDPNNTGANDTYALSDKGISMIYGAFGGIPYFSKGGGGNFTWTEQNGKIILTAAMPEMKEALTLLNKWYKDGLIDPEFISGENKGQYWGLTLTFANGKIGFSCPGAFYHTSPPFSKNENGSKNYKAFKELHPEGSYIPGKPLIGPEGKMGAERWSTFPGIYVALGKQVAEDEKKMNKILEINDKLVSDYELWLLSRFGIEGEHYEVGGEETGNAIISKVTEPARLGLSTNGIGYLTPNNFDFMKDVAKLKYEYAEKWGNFTKSYSNVVWGGLPSYPQYQGTILKKIQENYILFITGERSVDEFDKFVDELNKAGLEQLTKEAQEWYEKFTK